MVSNGRELIDDTFFIRNQVATCDAGLLPMTNQRCSIMLSTNIQPILPVISQHAEESALLRSVRRVLVGAPHVKLHHLRRLDDRLAAHLDGLAVAGKFGWNLCVAALENPGVGEVFAATVRAIEDSNADGLNKLLALVEAVPASQPGLLSAFGWVSSQFLQGMIKDLLVASHPFQRQIGLAACAMHRVDPGAALVAASGDADASLRARLARRRRVRAHRSACRLRGRAGR